MPEGVDQVRQVQQVLNRHFGIPYEESVEGVVCMKGILRLLAAALVRTSQTDQNTKINKHKQVDNSACRRSLSRIHT